MGLSEIVYSSLMEEEKQHAGWSKATIDYVTSNKYKITTSIRGIAKSHNKLLQRADIDDLYNEILCYLHNCDDYNISKAYEHSNGSGAIVSLEGYVHSCVKFCVIRHITQTYDTEKSVVREYVKDDEGKELSLFDTIADSSHNVYSDFGYQLDSICKSFETHRYEYGPDIFQIWFVRLQTLVSNKRDRYKDILNVIGISKKDIAYLESQSKEEGAMLSIAKAVSLVGVEESLKVIRNYTYSADKIERVIELF